MSVDNTRNGGGLVGENGGTLLACYSTGLVNTSRKAGGLAGSNKASGTVRICYTTCRVWDNTSDRVGGFFGENTNNATASFRDNYWQGRQGYTDESVGEGSDNGILRRFAPYIQNPTGYSGIYATWDDEDVDGDGVADAPWNFGESDQYPVLKVDFNGDNTATWQEFGEQRLRESLARDWAQRHGVSEDDISYTWTDFMEAKANGRQPILPDFSYTGYHYFSKPVPDVMHTVYNVTDYGAIANDNVSDQPAIRAAIAAAEANGSGIVFFPAGEFWVNTDTDDGEPIYIRSSNIVLRGSGSRGVGATIIRQVNDLPEERPNWPWTVPYLFQFKPLPDESSISLSDENSIPLGDEITADAARETFWLTLSSTSSLSVGQRITVNTRDAGGLEFLHPYTPVVDAWKIKNRLSIAEKHTIAEIQGNRIRLSEPLHVLRVDADDHDWLVTVQSNYLEEVGVEDISFHGSWLINFEHHKEGAKALHNSGWSSLAFFSCFNSWMRRVSFVNFNRSFKIENCGAFSAYHVTIAGNKGHFSSRITDNSYGVWNGLMEDLASQHHGLNVMGKSTGIVYWRADKNIDAHASMPYANLFDLVYGSNLSGHGGHNTNYPNHLRHFVLWNFKHGEWSSTPSYNFWPLNDWSGKNIVKPIIVGFHGQETNFTESSLEILESNGSAVEPESLFEAQLELRQGSVSSYLNDLRTEWEMLRNTPLTVPTILFTKIDVSTVVSRRTIDLDDYIIRLHTIEPDEVLFNASSSDEDVATVSTSGSRNNVLTITATNRSDDYEEFSPHIRIRTCQITVVAVAWGKGPIVSHTFTVKTAEIVP